MKKGHWQKKHSEKAVTDYQIKKIASCEAIFLCV
ncbi:hypothetical protein Pvag_2325 [Pantoea vagans C9-1]|nr:hypothetical protein Pvag_2325 [Pantoea vagans C9-1]